MRQQRELARRRATARDVAFCEDTHVRALGPIALVGYGWWAEKVREHFQREIDIEDCWIIAVDGRDAGYLSIADRVTFRYIDAIALLPRYQGHGIGTSVLRTFLAETMLPIRLNVLHVNRAGALYTRLGFRIIHRDAQRQVMEWRP